MSLSVAKANLADALKTLRQRLDKTRSVWDDDAARRFEQDFIAPLDAKVLMAVKGLDHVAELTAAVRRDCGDDHAE
jgi:hypothetical protein